jgi:N-acetylglucosamine kinase-like BadF-type ATPase
VRATGRAWCWWPAPGRSATGETSGGFGYLLADEGSGWWIGQQAMRAVVRASDGRGPATSLQARVLAHFAVAGVPLLVHEVYHRDPGRRRMAALGPAVDEAAAEGDVVARQILADAAAELVTAVRSVAERLELRGAQIPVILAGGVFRVVPSLEAEVIARVAEVVPRSQPRRLDVEPAEGAVRLAIAEARGGARVPTYI